MPPLLSTHAQSSCWSPIGQTPEARPGGPGVSPPDTEQKSGKVWGQCICQGGDLQFLQPNGWMLRNKNGKLTTQHNKPECQQGFTQVWFHY